MKRHNWALFAVVVALNVVDLLSTFAGLGAGAYETNPVMRWVFAEFGLYVGGILSKAIALTLALALSMLMIRVNGDEYRWLSKWMITIVFSLAIVVYSVIVASNLYNLYVLY